MSSIPGLGTKIPHAAQCDKKKIGKFSVAHILTQFFLALFLLCQVCKKESSFHKLKADQYMRVYSWHIYKLDPTKNSLHTQSKIHLSAYLHNAYKVNTKLILITLVQYICDTCTETYTNIFKTKEVFLTRTSKATFFNSSTNSLFSANIQQD